MTKRDGLTVRQSRFVAAMLTHRSIEDAAIAANVHRGTAFSWLKLPHVQAAVRQAQGAAIEDAARELAVLNSKALAVLDDLLCKSHADDHIRLRTAVHTLTIGLKLHELVTIEARLAALETGHEGAQN